MNADFHPLDLNPDMADADRRWEAFWQGELLDRPLDPARPAYAIGVRNQKEIDDVIGWFAKNT